MEYPQKNNWNNWNWNKSPVKVSPKKQEFNEIRHFKTHGAGDANPRKRDRMYPNSPLKGHKTPSAPLLPALFTLSSAHIRAPELRHQYLIFEGICG